MPSKKRKKNPRSGRRQLVATVGVVAAVFAGIVWFAGSDEDTVVDAGTSASSDDSEGSVARREPSDAMAVGDVGAPVVMVEWLDLRCPFCALFSRQTLPQLMNEYVEPGLVRYEVRDIALFGDQSVDASVAARAAAEQGLFHEYLAAVYDAAPDGAKAELDREDLIGFAEQVGVPDMAKFEADLDREDLRQAVETATTQAGRLGVTSVPFFAVDDVAFSGAQPVEVFRDVIDDALATAEAR